MPTFRMVVTIDHPSLGGRGTNTWHIRTPGEDAGSASELDSISTRIEDFYVDVSGVFPTGTQVKFDGQFVGVGTAEGEFIGGTAWSAGLTGVGDPLPPSQCVCVTWVGSSGDRSRRGRTFIGPLNTDTLDTAGTPTADVLGVMRTAAQSLVDDMSGNIAGSAVVYSRQENVSRDFVAMHISDQFAVLRSRRD